MNNRLLIILITTLLLGACAKEDIIDQPIKPKGVLLSLSVNTLAVNDPMSINQDQTFSSMALYLYSNDANSTLEKSALLPSFTPIITKDIFIQTQVGTKTLYLIANYTGKTFRLTDGTALTLSPTTTKQQLDNIITESSGGFTPNALLMLGKQTLVVTSVSNGTVIGVVLRRPQARVDVHVFKGPNFGTHNVTLESITLHNQVLNSEAKFDYLANTSQMLTSPMFSTQLIANNSVLSPYVSGTALPPARAC